MSHHRLSDDLSDWPEDPYELLAVRHGVSDRELKRAYASLLRAFKPEQYPVHFRRIRDAYEVIRSHLEYFRFEVAEDSEDETRQATAPEPQADSSEGVPSQTSTPEWEEAEHGEERSLDSSEPGIDPGKSESLGQLWELALAGEETIAYARLLESFQRDPLCLDVTLRLYWLLRLWPGLDHERAPADWLVTGIGQAGANCPHWELYHREVEAEPREALHERFAKLMDTLSSPGWLAELAQWRWLAADRLGQWNHIIIDLDRLKPRLHLESQETWLHLLCTAYRQIVWSTDPATKAAEDAILGEIDGYDHLHLNMEELLDRLQNLIDCRNGWNILARHGVPESLLRLITVSTSRPFSEIRPILRDYLHDVGARLKYHLGMLDMILKYAPAVLAQLGHTLTMYRYSLETLPEATLTDDVRQAVGAFLWTNRWRTYPKLRGSLLEFCVQENSSPELVALIAAERLPFILGYQTDFSEAVQSDWPLRYAYLAYWLGLH